jgi:hypothetical protein
VWRLEITKSSQAQFLVRQNYVENAFVPVGNWMPISPSHLAALQAPTNLLLAARTQDEVQLLRFSDSGYHAFKSLREVADRFGSVMAARQYVHGASVSVAIAAVTKEVASRFPDSLPLTVLGVNVVEPGLCTGSLRRPPIRRYVGMHVDQWRNDQILAGERASRLCINIGQEARYFLMINRSIRSMQGLLRTSIDDEGVIAKDFLIKFREYPVIRIELQPGKGYLAMTRNIIHDATTLEMSALDLSVSYLGNFI